MRSTGTIMLRRTLALLLCVFSAALAVGTVCAKSFPPEEMIGEWRGDGKIIVTWCRQERLPFHLFVRADGRVSGSVGNAAISDGFVKKNSWFLDWLGNPEYMIEATLGGSIVASEGIRRESIKLIVDLVDHELHGGFHTSGSKVGGKDSMILSGTSVKLFKVQLLDPEVGQVRLREFVGEERVRNGDLRRIRLRKEHALAERAEHRDEPEVGCEIG